MLMGQKHMICRRYDPYIVRGEIHIIVSYNTDYDHYPGNTVSVWTTAIAEEVPITYSSPYDYDSIWLFDRSRGNTNRNQIQQNERRVHNIIYIYTMHIHSLFTAGSIQLRNSNFRYTNHTMTDIDIQPDLWRDSPTTVESPLRKVPPTSSRGHPKTYPPQAYLSGGAILGSDNNSGWME